MPNIRPHIMYCKKCGKDKDEDSFYRRSNGKIIHGCRECRLAKKPRDPSGHHAFAIEAEWKAALHFMRHGYFVKGSFFIGTPGPDLQLIAPDGSRCDVEVKSVGIHKGCYYASAVSKNRKNDLLIAFVWPDGSIQIENMPEHLSKCGKNGKRLMSRPAAVFGGERWKK